MQIDILCISETWLNADIGNSEIEIDNYVLYRLDWNDNRRRGICIYTKSNIDAKK